MLTLDFKQFDLREGHRVLDAGCGGGRHTFRALMAPCDVWATDLSRQELGNVKLGLWDRQLQGFIKGRCLPFRGDIFRLPFPDGFFDRVIVAEVMEHLHEDVRALEELVRVLKPGGKIAVTVPTCFTERLYRRLSWEYFHTPGGHVRIYHPFELARKIAERRLSIYGVSFAHALHTPYWILRCIFGLHDQNARIPKWYHWLLIKFAASPTMTRVENFLNYLFPKSIVLYAQK
jgi:SAM-dependent methyltransferase